MNLSLISATGSRDRDTKAQPQNHTGKIRKGDQGGLQVVVDNILSSDRLVGSPTHRSVLWRGVRSQGFSRRAFRLTPSPNWTASMGLSPGEGRLADWDSFECCCWFCLYATWLVVGVAFGLNWLIVCLPVFPKHKTINVYTVLCTCPFLYHHARAGGGPQVRFIRNWFGQYGYWVVLLSSLGMTVLFVGLKHSSSIRCVPPVCVPGDSPRGRLILLVLLFVPPGHTVPGRLVAPLDQQDAFAMC